jgi:hypothetical protein
VHLKDLFILSLSTTHIYIWAIVPSFPLRSFYSWRLRTPRR